MKKQKTIFDDRSYSVQESENGFRIFRKDFVDATVSFCDKFNLSIQFNNDSEKETRICFIRYRDLSRVIVDHVFDNWHKNNKEKIIQKNLKSKIKYADPSICRIQKYVKTKLGNGVGFYLFPAWKNLVQKADPTVLSVLKKYISVRGPKNRIPQILRTENIYNHKHIVNDLIKYNAIHYVIENAEFEYSTGEEKIHFTIYRNASLTNHNNWRCCFSNSRETYRNLNKTLDCFPRTIPGSFINIISNYHFKEPVTDRIKLIALCCALENDTDRDNINFDCIENSSESQIRKAFKIFKKNYEKLHKLKYPRTLRGMRGISDLITYIFDYPEKHNGEIVGLLEKSHKWHREQQAIREARLAQQRLIYEKEREEKMNTKSSLPPIDLPKDENIIFLSNGKEIVDEGVKMKHCIGNYVDMAINGDCYLFHVDYKDQQASIMVNSEGRVVQSYGVLNVINEASEWAKVKLEAWGRKIKELQEVEV